MTLRRTDHGRLERQGRLTEVDSDTRDSTENKRAEEAIGSSEHRYRALFEDAKDAIFMTTLDGEWLDVNSACVELLGFGSKQELFRSDLAATIYQDARDREQLKRKLAEHGFVKDYELQLKTKQGASLVVLESSTVITGDSGEIVGYQGILHNITEQRRLEDELRRSLEQLEYRAFHDPLTDLPNREALHRFFSDYIAQELKAGEKIGLALLDLDRFKDINDALGHHVGDQVLKDIGPRVAEVRGDALHLYRLGGDEFAVVLPRLDSHSMAVEVTVEVVNALKRPFKVGTFALAVSASAGVAIYPEHGCDSHELLRCSDVALYEAKRALKGVELYSREADPNTPERLALMADLARALERDEFFLQYQPKIALATGRIVGFEALIRWQHHRLGEVPPEEFIPLAELSDVINPLTDWVLTNALSELKSWNRIIPDLTMAINLSARSLLDHDCADRLGKIIERQGVDPRFVEFELTETALMTDLESSTKTFQRLVALGARLTIDDFGTGYSSLAYLKRLSIDSLKIDRSFVSDMLRNEQSFAIVFSTLQMAHNLGLDVVAEGVEDEATSDTLRRMQCEVAQGFYYARPQTAAVVDRQLVEETGSPWGHSR